MFQVKGLKKEDLKIVAEELGIEVEVNAKLIDIREAILQSEIVTRDAEFVKEVIVTTVTEQKDREEKQFELEKSKLEIERMQAEAALSGYNTQSNFITFDTNEKGKCSIESTIKSIRTLTMPVPTKPEAWSLFFASLERAFETKKVEEDIKAEILLNILGEKATNILIYIQTEELNNYEAVKKIVLREYEPSAQICLENFKKMTRQANETHVQFASRLKATWEYYCKLRKVTDFETLKQLIISDRLFESLDKETAVHISILKGEDWFDPITLGRKCDIFYTSKGKSLAEVQNHTKIESEAKYIPPPLRNMKNVNSAKQCFICNKFNHIARHCPQRFNKTSSWNASDEKPKDKNQEMDQKEPLVAKVDAELLNNPFHALQKVDIVVNGKEISAILDSGTQIPIIHSSFAENLKSKGKIDLTSAFGQKIEADMMRLPVSIKTTPTSCIHDPVDVLVAVTDKLSVSCLLPPDGVRISNCG